MENQMEIKSTNEIAGNIFGKVYFKCPFCNSEKVEDKPEEGKDVFEYNVFGSPNQKIGDFVQSKYGIW